MQSPLLPWEVIERVISHSGDHPETLFNLSLTCRQLRPRALCFLVADVTFKTRDGIFSFCDFLEDRPHLKPLVHSIAVDPSDFAPFPILHILPNLSKISFDPGFHRKDYELAQDVYLVEDESVREVDSSEDGDSSTDGDASDGEACRDDEPSEDDDRPEDHIVVFPPGSPIPSYCWKSSPQVVLNRPILTCCQRFGIHVQALHFSHFEFSTYITFAQVLLAFTNVTHLACTKIDIRAEGNRAHLEAMKQRLFQRLHLLDVKIDSLIHTIRYESIPSSVAAFLLDSGLVQPTVETLTVENPYKSYGLSRQFDWPRLQSLVLKLTFTTDAFDDALTILEDFHALPALKGVTADIQAGSIHECLPDEDMSAGQIERLEQALLRFAEPRLVYTLNKLRVGTWSFWTQEIGKFSPVLLQRGRFAITYSRVIPRAGHEAIILDHAPSPDGKWMATSSCDSTIILWDATNGAMARKWIAHGYTHVNCLAFSPDGRYLVSGGKDSTVKVWDVAEGSRLVATLEGHTRSITHCVWSPRNDRIASGSRDNLIRLWDTDTFHEPVYVLELPDRDPSFQFCPDGRWLISGSGWSYQIWNVASGTLHQSFVRGKDLLPVTIGEGALDEGCKRLLLNGELGVTVVDVKTGEDLAILPPSARSLHHRFITRDPAFSPDGTLISIVFPGGTLKLWDAYTYSELFSLEHSTSEMKTLVLQSRFSPCGKYIASVTMDGTVRLWGTKDGSCKVTFVPVHTVPARDVAFSRDGETLWCCYCDGEVIMRRMRDVIPMDNESGLVIYT